MPQAPETNAPERTAVAWCLDCKYWIPVRHIGETCWGDGSCPRRLVRRVMYVCTEDYCSCAYRTKKAFEEHSHGECY